MTECTMFTLEFIQIQAWANIVAPDQTLQNVISDRVYTVCHSFKSIEEAYQHIDKQTDSSFRTSVM